MRRGRTAALGAATAMALTTVISTSPASADEPKLGDLMRLIEKQQQQINTLRSELEKTQGKADQAAAVAEEVKKSPGFLDSIKVGGVAEVEATDSKDFTGASSSDITLSKVELYVDTQPHEYLSTHVQLLYEDGQNANENVRLDEAYATLGNTEKFPVYLQAGKWSVPFGGDFDTAMSTDPMTKLFGEVHEASILLGGVYEGFTLQGYAFNGDTQKSGEGDNIDQFGVSLSYGGEKKGVAYNGGVSYVNNIADADPISDALTSKTALADYVGGFEAHGDVSYSGFTVRAGYMKALDSFKSGELAFNGQGAQPSAWNVEGSYTTEILTKETTFAGTVQGTDEALALGLPERRYGGAVTVGIVERFSVTAEYLHDEDYDVSEGGTGNSGHTATLKLAAEY